MRILITGADQALGQRAAEGLRQKHSLRLTGVQAEALPHRVGLEYSPADLREPAQVEPLVAGIDAIVHLAVFERATPADAAGEKELLDWAARGTYVLLHAALNAGVSRVVLASRLDLLAAYPPEYVVDETWRPHPRADAASLAPYLAELTLREFVRAEDLMGVCLRLGELGQAPDGTTPEDALAAIERALEMDLETGTERRKYRWWLYHICSSDRYPLGAAAQPPFSFTRTGSVA